MAELVLCSGFFLVYLVEEVVQLLVHPNAHQDNLNSHQSSKAVDKGQGRDGERANSCCDATNHNDMEMQPRSESSTSESSIDPGYNPKYSVRLSLTTSSVFPNYHSPDSLKPSPQEKPFPSPSRLFLFLAKPIDEKKSQQHQKKSHQKQQKTHKPRHASTRPTTFSSNNSLVDRRTSRLSSTSFWPRSSRPCALLGSACDHGLAIFTTFFVC